MPLLRELFSLILSNSPDLDETAVKGAFKVVEFESILKMKRRPILGALGHIFAYSFGLT